MVTFSYFIFERYLTYFVLIMEISKMITGVFQLYNILLVGDNTKVFADLEEHLRKDFFSLFHYRLNEIHDNLTSMSIYDFVLMHIDNKNELPIQTIQAIKTHSRCPLYAFSEGHTSEDTTKLLEYGCEGHISIPYNPIVTASRIKAVLRFLNQIKHKNHNVINVGRFSLHVDNREVHFDDQIIQLTKVEFKILQLLIEHRDVVVSKDKIIHAVWDDDVSATDNALGIHITRLRKKLPLCDGQELVETIWGLGYRINFKACENKLDVT